LRAHDALFADRVELSAGIAKREKDGKEGDQRRVRKGKGDHHQDSLKNTHSGKGEGV